MAGYRTNTGKLATVSGGSENRTQAIHRSVIDVYGDVSGKAEEAVNFYLSVFKNSKRGTLERYPAGMEPDNEGTVMYSDFMIEDQWFAVMDSAQMHGFSFNEAISLLVRLH